MSTPKQLDLSGLTEAERDAKVNEAVSCVTGVPCDSGLCYHCGFEAARHRMGDQEHSFTPDFTPYATDANAVLTLLNEKLFWNSARYPDDKNNHRVTVQPDIAEFEGYAPTFPLAACYALLRAHGIEVLT